MAVTLPELREKERRVPEDPWKGCGEYKEWVKKTRWARKQLTDDEVFKKEEKIEKLPELSLAEKIEKEKKRLVARWLEGKQAVEVMTTSMESLIQQERRKPIGPFPPQKPPVKKYDTPRWRLIPETLLKLDTKLPTTQPYPTNLHTRTTPHITLGTMVFPTPCCITTSLSSARFTPWVEEMSEERYLVLNDVEAKVGVGLLRWRYSPGVVDLPPGRGFGGGEMSRCEYQPETLTVSTGGEVRRVVVEESNSNVKYHTEVVARGQVVEISWTGGGVGVGVEIFRDDTTGVVTSALVVLQHSSTHRVATGGGVYMSPTWNFHGDEIAWLESEETDAGYNCSDGCVLYTGDFCTLTNTLRNVRRVDGSGTSMVTSPIFLQDNTLIFTCDKGCDDTRLYAVKNNKKSDFVINTGSSRVSREVGFSTLTALKTDSWSKIAILCSKSNLDLIVVVDIADRRPTPVFIDATLRAGLTRIWSISALDSTRIAVIAGGECHPRTAVVVNVESNTVRKMSWNMNPARHQLSLPKTSRRTTITPFTYLYTADTSPDNERKPLIVCPHTGWSTDWYPDAYDGWTEVMVAKGFVVVHVVLKGAVGWGRVRRGEGVGKWLSEGARTIVETVGEVCKVVGVDLHKVIVKGSSIDALPSLAATYCKSSLITAAVISGGVPSLYTLATSGTLLESGFPPTLHPPTESLSLTSLRVPIHFSHSIGDPLVPFVELMQFSDVLNELQTYHGRAEVVQIKSALHPPPWDATVERELEFIERVH